MIVAFQVHEKWKGRIDQWQPKRKQRRPQRRNTKKALNKKNKRGTQKASPKFLRGRILSREIYGILNEELNGS